MQLVSVEGGWFLVLLHRAGEAKEGWVPSTYVERKWDVNLDKLSLAEQQPGRKADLYLF